jgi:hypothetical protein
MDILYNDAVNSSGYVVTNGSILTDLYCGKGVEESDRGRILGSTYIVTFAWRDWERIR